MITRRKALSAAAAAVAVITARSARAQGSYPDKLIKMYVPAPAGGQTDVLARLLAQKIQAAVGQNVIIDGSCLSACTMVLGVIPATVCV